MRKNKKNIIFFMPFIDCGGVEKNLIIITNYLCKKISNVKICSLSLNKRNKFDKKIKFISPSLKVARNLNIKIKYLICLYTLLKFLLKNKNSIVFTFQANIYCVLLCKLLNIKVIVRNNSSPSGWNHNIFKKLIYKYIMSKSDKIIVNSLDFQKQMKKKLNLKTECILNPLNISEIIRESKRKIYQNYFRKKTLLKIINIGRFTDQKDQITILKAANILKEHLNFELLIIGFGEKKEELIRFVTKNNLSKFVRIISLRSNVYNVLNQSDIFILSSKYEGLPNVLLEAASLKKFIISTNCPTGPKEILLNGKGGLFFKTGDYNDLSKKIILYSKNRKKFNKKILTSFKGLERYDLEKNLKKYQNILVNFI